MSGVKIPGKRSLARFLLSFLRTKTDARTKIFIKIKQQNFMLWILWSSSGVNTGTSMLNKIFMFSIPRHVFLLLFSIISFEQCQISTYFTWKKVQKLPDKFESRNWSFNQIGSGWASWNRRKYVNEIRLLYKNLEKLEASGNFFSL